MLMKLAMVALTIPAVFFVYSFTLLVAPWYIALVASGSLVGVYLGLAYTPIPAEQRNLAIGVSFLAMMIEMLYAVLYILGVQSPGRFAGPLPLWADLGLAFLHGAPFTVLLFCISMLVVHHQHHRTERMSTGFSMEEVVLAVEQIQHQRTKELEVRSRPDIREEQGYVCPFCGGKLKRGEVGAAHKNGFCRHCKGESPMRTAVVS